MWRLRVGTGETLQVRSAYLPPVVVACVARKLAGIRSGSSLLDLLQHSPAHRSPYPASSKLCILLLHLSPNEEAPELLGRYPTGPRSTERVEDEIPLPTGG